MPKNLRDEKFRVVHLFEGEAPGPEIFERRADVVKFRDVDDEEPVVHFVRAM